MKKRKRFCRNISHYFHDCQKVETIIKSAATETGAVLNGANLRQIDLNGVFVLNGKFEDADLLEACCKNAKLRCANFTNAQLNGVDFRGAKLQNSNFQSAYVANVKYNRCTRFKGIQIDGAVGNQRFVRFAKDQAYLEELRSGKWHDKLWYWIWLVFADCGRTPWAWLGWSIASVFLFSWIFFQIEQAIPSSFVITSLPSGSFWTYLYYSIVTFTTLGFGDITPNTPQASFWVGLEVIVGYVMLGGLISILATKLARRS